MIRTLLIACLLVAPTFAQNGSITGRVTDQAGEPLKNVLLRLQPIQPTSNGYYTESDASGNFVLDDIEPRSYNLLGSHPGYQGSGPRSPLTVAPGQTLAGISIRLKRWAEFIAGRVVDEDGAPMPFAQILLRSEAGLNAGSSAARSDGSFVIAVGPGRYSLSAEESINGTSTTFRDLSGPQLGYVATYFPSTADPSKAALIVVKPGEQVRNLEIRMTKGRLFHVGGKLIDQDTGMPLPSTALGFQSLAAQGIRQIQRTAKDGSFEFPRIVPGDYVLYQDQANQNPLRRVGRQKVTVASGNIDGLVLTVGPGLAIPGKFTAEGAVDTSMVRVRLKTDDPLQAEVYFQFSRQTGGGFEIRNLEPDVYRVGANNLPPGTYLKSVHFGDSDVTNERLDLTGDIAGKSLEVLLAPRAAEVTAAARNADGKPLDSIHVTLRGPGEFSATGLTDEAGALEFHNLAPGEYRIAAWPDSSQTESEFDAQATKITLREGASITIAPPLIVHKSAE